MKSKVQLLACVLVLGTALMQTQRAAGQETKTSTLADMKGQLTLLQGTITAVVESLEQVKASAKNDGSLLKAIGDFQSRYQALEGQFGTVRAQAVTARARAKDQYETWQKDLATVQNANIREKAQERFTDSKKEFDKIVEKAEKAKERAVPFVADVKDISIYFSADPSADAVKSLSNSIWKLGNKSKSLNGSISDVIEQIDRTLKSLPKK